MNYLAEVVDALAPFGIRADMVSFTNEHVGSDIAMPCFALAREHKKSPQAIAEAIASAIQHPAVEKAEAVAGYVNIWLKSDILAQGLNQQVTDWTTYGSSHTRNERVIIDYVSPNLAKPLSIGHLRNALQGKALANLYRSQGYEVITDSHLGDWGTVFGMWVVGYQMFSSPEKLEADGNRELGRVYVEMRKALKAEEADGGDELKASVQQWLQKLEADDPEAWEYHTLFKNISLTDTNHTLTRLGITFDETLGEAFYIKQARQLIEDLLQQGIAQRQSDGSIIVDLQSQGIDTPLLLQKSNGTLLYASSDIATIVYREERWQPSAVIYVVGAEQQFHFQQLFAFNEIVHYSDAELVHHWYGLVEELTPDGKRQKMSSRTGAVYLEDVLDTALERARKHAKQDMGSEDLEAVAYGAITFREFLQGHHSNVLFDWEEMFSLTGKSGPYVQYAAVRLQSVLQKASTQPAFSNSYDWQAEHELLMHVASYPIVENEALEQRELSKIAFYVYDLAKLLNRYYESTLVLDSDMSVQAARIWLMEALYKNMVHALGILGITVPQKM